MTRTRDRLAPAPSEPAVKCPACGAEMPLSSGWGPVGDKQFMCDRCGALSELVIRV